MIEQYLCQYRTGKNDDISVRLFRKYKGLSIGGHLDVFGKNLMQEHSYGRNS